VHKFSAEQLKEQRRPVQFETERVEQEGSKRWHTPPEFFERGTIDRQYDAPLHSLRRPDVRTPVIKEVWPPNEIACGPIRQGNFLAARRQVKRSHQTFFYDESRVLLTLKEDCVLLRQMTLGTSSEERRSLVGR
jgi:hypothetical protein